MEQLTTQIEGHTKSMKKIDKRSVFYIVAILIYSLTGTSSIFAETGYVSDMLILSLKEGPGRQYNTIKTLRSNTPVQIIETTDRFLKIETEEGDIGWVEGQYITKELPKSIIIEQLNKKIAELEAKAPNSAYKELTIKSQTEDVTKQTVNQPVSSENALNTKEAEYINKIKALETALNSQIEKNRVIEMQLKSSKAAQQNGANPSDYNITKSSDDNANIIEEDIEESSYQSNSYLEEDGSTPSFFSENNMLLLPDDDILKTAMIKWFCAGAAVLIAGWFIGRSFSGGRRGRGGLLD